MRKLLTSQIRILPLAGFAALLGVLMLLASSGQGRVGATVYTVLFLNSQPEVWVLSFLSATPLMVLAVVTAGSFTEDLRISELFVIPRIRSVLRWYAVRQASLLIQVTVYIAVYLTAIYGGYALIYKHSPLETPYLVPSTLLFALFCYVSVLTVNVLALKISPKWAVVGFVAALAVGIVTVVPEPQAFFIWVNPAYHFFRNWRIASDASSVICAAVLICASIILGAHFITKKQIRGV
ncbi:MAG: hypothetical protein LBR85_01195 [Oscillospiraceae bacterium]|jgi:hypothetical protein|nr:hypothetical protein [Oscillospiraceae bacterium]